VLVKLFDVTWSRGTDEGVRDANGLWTLTRTITGTSSDSKLLTRQSG